MSIKGIRLSDGTVEKYGFPYLDDIDVQLQHLGSDVRAVLNNKADIDGSYINLNAGTADNLNSSVGIEDQTPYNFRTSGGSTEIGDREELNAVVGVSVPWNQNLQAMNSTYWQASATGTEVTFADGVATVNASLQYAGINNKTNNRPTFPTGHKILYSVGVKLTTAVSNAVRVKINNQDQKYAEASTSWQTIQGIFAWNSANAATFNVFDARSADRDAYQVKEPMLIDLTAMFGSTIADYIYSLEQANVGSSVSWFRKYFPKLYYGYSAPTTLSVKTSAHKMTGFNQWDEEWELGYYNVDTGVSGTSNSQIRCKNKIKVVPNTTYYIKTSGMLWILEYDADDIYLNKYISKTNQVFTTSANTRYIRFYALSTYGTTYKNDICINLHWDGERDGEYEPYVAHEYAMSDITLRGILKLDANNNLYADGDRYLPDGTVERRYGIVDLGALNWTKISDGVFSNSTNNGYKIIEQSDKPNMICSKYITETWQSINNGTQSDKSIHLLSGSVTKQIRVFDSAYTDKDTFTTAMSGVYLVFELETPTTESADPYQQTQIVDDFGTEEFVDAAVEANERDVAIPVGHETFYQNNLKAKLEMAPNSPDGDGVYVVQQTNGENEYIPLVIPVELPTFPSDDGTYVFKITVSGGTVTKAWVEEV